MDPVTQHLISSYLLMPVLTVIFGIAAYFIARKNKLLNNKKLIVYLLLCGIVLALPGLSGFMDYNFMPYIYVLLAILYWTAGYYNRFLLRKVFASGKETPSFGIRCLLTVTVVLLGAGALLRSVQPLQRTPVRYLGLYLPAAFRLPAPVHPDGKQLF